MCNDRKGNEFNISYFFIYFAKYKNYLSSFSHNLIKICFMCRGRKSAVSYDPEEVVCMFYLQNFMKKLILRNISSSEML